MQQKTTYKLTGLFVILGFLGLAAIIFNYVGEKFTTKESELVVMYFDESVRGLSVGSGVVLQGVEIGKVERIQLIPDLKSATFKTPVYVKFDKKAGGSYVSDKTAKATLRYLIDKGLRARLMSSNYLTGQLMIELLMDPEAPEELRGGGNNKYLEIPTIYSSFAMISKDLKEIPMRESLARLGSILEDLEENMPGILQNINAITAKIERVMDKKNSETSNTLNNFNNTLEDIGKASISIKNLTDYLERHPEAILRGKEK